MTDEVMDGTEPIECAAKPTVKEWMEPFSGGDRRGDLESPIGPHTTDEFFVAFIRLGTAGERNPYTGVTRVAGQEGEEVIGLSLELSVGFDHSGVAVGAPRMDIALAHCDGG